MREWRYCTRWRWVVSFTPRLTSTERSPPPQYPLHKSLVWTAEPVWTLWRKPKPLSVAGYRTLIPRSYGPQPSHCTDWAIPATPISQFIVKVVPCSVFRTNYRPSHVWSNIPLPIYVICSPTQNRKTLSSVYIPVIRKISSKESLLEGHTQRVLTFTDPRIISFIAVCYKSHGFFFLEVRKVFCGGGGSNVFIPKIPAWGLDNWNGYMEHRGLTMMWGAVSPKGRKGGHMMIHNFVTTLPSFQMAFLFFLQLYALIRKCPCSNMTL
jgi:hypothetical protein